MKGNVSKFIFAFLVLGLVLVPIAKNFAEDAPQAPQPETAAAPAPAAVPAEGMAAGSFSRHADPVVLKGEQVPEFAGVTEDELRVFAAKNGKLEPIPYQMDERNQWGEFVVVKGKRVEPDEDNGKLDDNDEIVFLTRDIGTKVPKDQWPTGYKKAYEVEVTDPLTSAKGYAYVMSYASASAAPPKSSADYVSYEEVGEGLTKAINYEIGFLKVTSGLDYNYLVVTKAAGGDGINHFDKLKVRVIQNIKRYITLGFSPRLDNSEVKFLVKVYGYKDGPVRVLRVMKTNLQLLWKLPAPGSTVNSVLYPEWIEWPVPVNLPFKPSWAFYNIELDVSHDYAYKPTDGVKVYNSLTNRWDAVDGKMSPEEQAVNRMVVTGGYYGYDATSIGAGAGFYTVRMPKSFSTTLVGLYLDSTETGVEPEYYKGDGNVKNRHEWIKGAMPLAGGRFINWGDVGRGIHTVYYYHFYPPFYKPGKEKEFLNIIDHPVQVAVQ
jgi:hypothetical protein